MANTEKAKPAKKGRAKPQKPKRKLLTRNELADHFGVVPFTVTRWEQDGMPVAERPGRGKPSYYDLEAVSAWKEQVERDRLENEELSLSDERAKLTVRQREKLELEIAVRRGQLIERELVVRAGQQYTKAWVSKLRVLPRQLVQAGILPREGEAAASARIRTILEDIAAWQVPHDDGDGAEVSE